MLPEVVPLRGSAAENPMDDEFREIVRLGPVLLRREHLASLEQMLSDGLTLRPDYPPVFKLEHGSKAFSANSIADLLRKTLPPSCASFSAHLTSWDANEIDASVQLTLYNNFGQFQLHARNEALFLGKKQQLVQFFRERLPWYGWITRLLPLVGPPTVITALFFGALLFSQGRRVTSGLCLLLASTTWLTTLRAFQNRIFPYIRVELTEPEKRPTTWEIATFFLQLALLLATIASIAVPLTHGQPPNTRPTPVTPTPPAAPPHNGGTTTGNH
jgi:hypothetical protein